MNGMYKAYIESNGKGWYSVYTEQDFPFGVYGEGKDIEEAKDDFLRVFAAMAQWHKQETGEGVVAEFEFVLDTSALIHTCSKYVSLASLSKALGIKRSVLLQYACGKRCAKSYQRGRIVNAIHAIGRACLTIE